MFRIGDIVYLVDSYGYDYSVKYGIINDRWKEFNKMKYWVNFLRLKDARYVNGIPISDFIETDWIPTPKEYRDDYYGNMITLQNMFCPIENKWTKQDEKIFNNFNIKDPKQIKKAYENGTFILNIDYIPYEINMEIDRYKPRFKFIKKNRAHSFVDYIETNKRKSIILEDNSLFSSYDEADAHKQYLELKRQEELNLTDEEWNFKDISKFLSMYYDPDEIDKYMKVLTQIPDFGNIDVRKTKEGIEFRHMGKNAQYELLKI